MAMKMLARAINELSEEVERLHSRLIDNNYGFGKLRNRRTMQQDSLPENHNDGFEISLNVAQFNPEDLLVRALGNVVIIEGHHEERKDNNGYIQRNFKRRCVLPKGYDPQTVSAMLLSDGILTITAPAPPIAKQQNKERIVKIIQTESKPTLKISDVMSLST